jgi:hypothetical protein
VFVSTAPAYNLKQEERKAEGKSNYDSILDRNASGQYHLAVPFFDSTILVSAFGHY